MEMKHNESRRGFLKKAAYTAPAIMALGALNTPLNAMVVAPSNLVSVSKEFNTLVGQVNVTRTTDKTTNKVVSTSVTGPRGRTISASTNSNGSITIIGPFGRKITLSI